MTDFDPVLFVGNPSVDELKTTDICKDDLKYIAKSYSIPFTSSTTKTRLKDLILAHLDGDHTPLDSNSSNPAQSLEIEKVKLEAMKLKLQYELAERETIKLNLERERERRQDEREERERERHELQLLQFQRSPIGLSNPETFDVAKNLKLVPMFMEDNPEAFFKEFECTASHFKWPKEHWLWLVRPKLKGKAITVCDRLEDNTNYDHVKETILAAYSISTEGYRQAFKNLNKPSNQTYAEFASERLQTFHKWLKSATVDTFDKLVNLIVLEEFKRKVPFSIMTHIIEREETDLIKAAKIADVFSLIHCPMQEDKKKPQHIVKSDAGSI